MNNASLHALKSLSCFTAVTYYSTSHICDVECFLHDKTLNAFYFLSMIAKPIFFIIIGYIDEEMKITAQYAFFKIKSIFLIVAFWNVLFLFMDASLFKRGYLLQNGILLSIAIIYLCHPLLIKVLQLPFGAALSMLCLAGVSVLLNLSSASREIPNSINSSDYYDVFISVAYYLFGRVLGAAPGQRVTKTGGMLWTARIGMVPTAALLILYERFISNGIARSWPWYFLEPLIISVLCLMLFIIFDNLMILNKFIVKMVSFVSPTMVGVYIIHYSVFYLFSTAYDINNVTLRFTLLVTVFMASVIVSRLLLLNKYTSKIISL